MAQICNPCGRVYGLHLFKGGGKNDVQSSHYLVGIITLASQGETGRRCIVEARRKQVGVYSNYVGIDSIAPKGLISLW